MTPAESDTLFDPMVEDVLPAPDNTRGDGPDEDMPALVASMKTLGQQQAITVFENPTPPGGRKTYTVIAGHRRLMAAKFAGMTTIRAILVAKPSRAERRHLMRMAENKARKGHTLHEDVDAVVKAKRENPEMTGKQIADLTGYSEAELSKLLAIGACPVAYPAVCDGRITAQEVAYGIAKAASEHKQGLLNIRLGPAGKAGFDEEVKKLQAQSKPRAKSTVTLSTIKMPLTTGVTVTVRGEEIGSQELVDALSAALDAARKSQKEQIDVKTLARVMADKAKAV